jgi:hypothetical protein
MLCKYFFPKCAVAPGPRARRLSSGSAGMSLEIAATVEMQIAQGMGVGEAICAKAPGLEPGHALFSV